MQISVGCNMKCSYCIVPTTRGREVDRPLDELVAEARAQVAQGVREVTLLGQNVNAYGRHVRGAEGGATSFARLLAELDAIDGLRPHPLHEPAPAGHEGGRGRRARGAVLASARTCTSRCSPARRAS